MNREKDEKSTTKDTNTKPSASDDVKNQRAALRIAKSEVAIQPLQRHCGADAGYHERYFGEVCAVVSARGLQERRREDEQLVQGVGCVHQEGREGRGELGEL